MSGGRVSRPLLPRLFGSRDMMETAKGIVFCDDMIIVATASRGGNRNSLCTNQVNIAQWNRHSRPLVSRNVQLWCTSVSLGQ